MIGGNLQVASLKTVLALLSPYLKPLPPHVSARIEEVLRDAGLGAGLPTSALDAVEIEVAAMFEIPLKP